MYKLIIKSEDIAEIQRHLQATDMSLVLWDVSQEIFRPARKHGYSLFGESHKHMNIEEWSDETHKVVETLETMFFELLEARGVSLD